MEERRRKIRFYAAKSSICCDDVGVEVGGIGSGSGVGGMSDFGVNEIKLRGGATSSSDSSDKGKLGNGTVRMYEEKERTLESKTGEPVKHYDADGTWSSQ